jgi:Ankyrin repeats (3 copies)
MPTKHLPSRPSLTHLKYQARDLLRAHAAGDPKAIQRLREFHPRFNRSTEDAIRSAKLTLSDAQLAIAREYGFPSWARLKAQVERPERADLALPHHERIEDPAFRRAVDLLDAGDADGLRAHLQAHPGVVRQRVAFEGGNYFQSPALLEFAAENPVRHGRLPANLVEVAKVVLDAGAKTDRSAVDSALGLVSSARVARECGAQVPLIDLLCDHGADPSAGMLPALTHGEFAAVDALLRRGATLDLTVAAATGRLAEAQRSLPAASPEERHRALALAAQHGHAEVVRLLLDAGEDPDRYNPVGCHSHSTPLHQAAFYGHEGVVRLLAERGARLNIKDILHQGTPLGWAEHAGRTEIGKYLRNQADARGMFLVAESVDGDAWTNIAGIFSTRAAAERFRDSLSEEWSYGIFPISPPREYPFLLTNHGLRLPSVRYITEDELQRLLAEVPSGPREDRILFNVYSVKEDCFNEVFPGEPLLPKLNHYHIMAGKVDFKHIKKSLLTWYPRQKARAKPRS